MLRLAIESVKKQSFKLWELLIIDNESSDNTKDVVDSYTKDDSRIRYYFVKKNPQSGIAHYLNYGIEVARGRYIARLDDDDEWYDHDKLSKQVEFLDENKNYVLVGGGAIMIGKNREEIFRFYKREQDFEIRNNALYANPFWHNTVMFRKRTAKEIGGYKPIRFIEDWDLWLRLGKKGKFYNFREYFSLYLNAGQNLSANNLRLASRAILQHIKAYRKEYPNFRKAFILNFTQYLFSFTPTFFRSKTQNLLFYIKRNYF
jgi:glycosyltransferase involved in cell wall biosynthesis